MRVVGLNDLAGVWESVRDASLRAIDRVGRSGWVILGSEVERFEAALARRWQLAHAIGCGNGLDAIEIGLRCLGLTPGTPVLTTPLSAFATSLAIVRAGGVPWFVDVDEHGLLDLDAVERALAAHAELRFLVPVHLYGHALDLVRLAELAQRFELRIVEDCAQAIDARSHGRPVGSVGQLAATSFYPTKNLGCFGDGGAVLTNDREHAARARSLRDYGQTAKYEHAILGLNSRLDEVHAAVMHDALLPRLDEFTARRRQIAERYGRELDGAAVRVVAAPAHSDSVWHLFAVLVDDADGFMRHMRSCGVGTGRHYPRVIPDQDALRGHAGVRGLSDLPRARRIAATEVSLPIHPLMSDADVARVIAACREYRA